MSQTKGISVSVDVDLHCRAKTEQEQLELTMSQYIAMVLNEHFEKGAGKNMSEKTRTLAFQVSEELFQRVKNHLTRNPKLSPAGVCHQPDRTGAGRSRGGTRRRGNQSRRQHRRGKRPGTRR